MKRRQRHIGFILGSLMAVLAAPPVSAHDSSHASVHDTVAGIILRMQRELSSDELIELTVPRMEAFLTAPEREVLGTAHIRFRVNVPVVVTILRDTNLVNEPFWLREREFNATGAKVQLSNREFDTWEKAFPAGEIGLGVHNLTGRGTHYLVFLRPQQRRDTIKVTDLYPAHLRTGTSSRASNHSLIKTCVSRLFLIEK